MNTDPDLPALSSSIWPYDTWITTDLMLPSDFRRMRCFVLCPFDRADITLAMIRNAALTVQNAIGHQIQVYYAGDITGPSAIHPDIWTHILQADIIVADMTGYNPNVMYELGVAAAWRQPSSVILIRDKCDGNDFAFDLHPMRQIMYESSSVGWSDTLLRQLIQSMLYCLVSVPFQHEPETEIPTCFEADLTDGKDTEYLWLPGPGHRRLIDDGLEFGSPHYFPYSWLSPPKLRPANVEVQAEMKFTYRIDSDSCWMGIALRSKGYLAGNGTEYLAWLRQDGVVYRTGPALDALGKDEHQVGSLTNFDAEDTRFVPFFVSMDARHWKIRVQDVYFSIAVSDLPHIFPYGRVMFQTFKCRAVIRRVQVRVL